MTALKYTSIQGDRFRFDRNASGNAYLEVNEGDPYAFVLDEELKLAAFFAERRDTQRRDDDAERELEMRADELRLAANEVHGDLGPEPGSIATWLHDRADRLWPDPAKVNAMRQALRESALLIKGVDVEEIDEDDLTDLARGLIRGGKVEVKTDG